MDVFLKTLSTILPSQQKPTQTQHFLAFRKYLVFNACSGFQTIFSPKLNLKKQKHVGQEQLGLQQTSLSTANGLTLIVVQFALSGSLIDTDLAEKLKFPDNLKCLTDALHLWREILVFFKLHRKHFE